MTTTEEKVNIQLGDILEINAPNDSAINNKIFFVKYIDKTKIILAGESGLETSLSFDETGKLDNESIIGINILSRASEVGYARQNGLLTGTWINIYFGGDVPVIFTGKITNLEEDMIELTTYPEKDVIYIDFGYKGIPRDLPIEKINIREPPAEEKQLEKEVVAQMPKAAVAEEELEEGEVPLEEVAHEIEAEAEMEALSTKLAMTSLEEPEIPVLEHIKTILLSADQIKIGTELGEITQVVDVPETEQRFGIDKQASDLLDEMLSHIPNIKRTEEVLKNIHLMIERFKQLRTSFSKFDDNGNALMPAIQGADFKPLVSSLLQFNQKLHWILPVVKNKRKIYDLESASETGANDITSLELAQVREAEHSIIKNYLEGSVPDQENKYSYLIKNLNPYFTPYNSPDENTDVLISKQVNTNISTIIDNLDDLYSSVASQYSGEVSLAKRRFVIQQYNLGMSMLESSKIKGGDYKIRRKQIVDNDILSLKSMLTLPEVTVRFSHINLPSTSILQKSNLNRNYINYWKFLNKSTNVSNVIVDKSDLYENMKDKFLEEVKEYILDNTLPETSTMNDTDKYKYYLEKVVPKTRVLFNLVKPYITGKLSVHEILNYLEPFMVYQSDLSFMQYQEMVIFIKQKIDEFKKNYLSSLKEYNRLNIIKEYTESATGQGTSTTISSRKSDFRPKVLSVLERLDEGVVKGYKLEGSRENLTNSEILSFVNEIDNSILFNDVYIKKAIASSLYGADVMGKLLDFKNEENAVEQELEENKINPDLQDNPCAAYKNIVKIYYDFDEMSEDNGKEIKVDGQFDDTMYELIKEYKFPDNATDQQKIQIAMKNLIEKNGLTEKKALREARAIVSGVRYVEPGDYAVVYDTSQGPKKNVYFIRDENLTWQFDNSVPPTMGAEDDKFFCNNNEKCFSFKKECISTDSQSDILNKAFTNDTLKAMISNADPDGKISRELMDADADDMLSGYLQNEIKEKERIIEEKVNEQKNKIEKLFLLRNKNIFKYDLLKHIIGTQVGDNEVVVSPYTKLRDIILSQADFVKRQSDIINFAKYFTREPIVKEERTIEAVTSEGTASEEGESPYWLYCNKTNVKLLPMFLYKLAVAFKMNRDYLKLVEDICKEQGTISDDGDAWVDKYSGYIIRKIDLSGEEEYSEEGFKVKSRDILEADMGDSIMQLNKAQKKYDSVDAQRVSNIVSAIAGFMGINIESKKEFIINNVIKQQSTIMPSKEVYEKAIAAAAAKGKKGLDDYPTAYNASLIILSLSYLLIAIQTSVPPVKTRKTHPGCIRSFDGFPGGGNEDLTGLTYIACIANKIKSGIEPWNAIQKLSVKTIVTKMEQTISKFIINTDQVKEAYSERAEYMKTHPLEAIPQEHNISTWTSFMPPLRPIKMEGTLQNVSQEFEREFVNDLRKGSKSQTEKLGIMEGKIIKFSNGIIDLIQKTVTKKAALLSNSNGEPFLENGCCDSSELKVLQYFINAQPEIVVYNNNVKKLGDIIYDAVRMRKAGSYLDPRDTKFKFPSLPNDFSEETIYKAFIHFCKFGVNVPISEDIKAICLNKPDNFSSEDSLTESITKLKRDGKNYSMQSLQQLLNIVNRNNKVDLNLHKTATSNIAVLRDLLNSMDERNVTNVPRLFREKFLAALENFEIGSLFQDSSEMRQLKNYLASANETMFASISEFIRASPSTKKKDYEAFKQCIENIDKFEETGDGMFIEKEDETVYKVINFIKNALRALTSEFPNIIVNGVDNSNVKVPRHWNLSERHNNDVKEIIKRHYAPLNGLTEDADLSLAMTKLTKLTRDINSLAKHTLFYAPIQLDANKYMYSVFDRRLSLLLFKFYFYSVYVDLMSLKDDDELLVKTFTRKPEGEEGEEGDKIDSYTTETANEMQNGNISEIEIVAGERKELANKLANTMLAFTTIICNDKDVIDYNYKSVMDRVLRSKEREKDLITNYLKEMTEEEREVENIFKNNRLERWSVGLQKGLVSYTRDTYDNEREAMEKQALIEMKLGQNSVVTSMNKDIFSFDQLETEASAQQIDAEENNITYLGEDAEYEDYGLDGDEEFY